MIANKKKIILFNFLILKQKFGLKNFSIFKYFFSFFNE